MTRRIGRGSIALAAAGVLLAACSHAIEGTRPDPVPDPSADLDCDFSAVAADSILGGQLEDGGNAIIRGRVRVPPGTLDDAFIIPLANDGSEPVLLERVVVMPEQDASELNFAGAFVAPATSKMRIVRASDRHRLTPVRGYCVPPLSEGSRVTPTLVLRIGPALPKDRHGFAVSRNNNVNLFYRTADGRSHVAVFPYRIEYPN